MVISLYRCRYTKYYRSIFLGPKNKWPFYVNVTVVLCQQRTLTCQGQNDTYPHAIMSTSNTHLPFNSLVPPHRNESFILRIIVGAVGTLIAASVVVLAVYLNTTFQNTTDYKVDIDNCTCDCWDRKFKGGYHAEGWRNVWFQMRPVSIHSFVYGSF